MKQIKRVGEVRTTEQEQQAPLICGSGVFNGVVAALRARALASKITLREGCSLGTNIDERHIDDRLTYR